MLFLAGYCAFVFLICLLLYFWVQWTNQYLCLEWSLFSSQRISLEIPLVLDEKSLSFLFSVSLISASVYMFSHRYMRKEVYTIRFHLLVLAFVKSMFILILSPNIFRLILGWDGLGVTSFLLVVYFQSKKSFNAGIITALTNRIGDVLLLMGIAYIGVNFSWEFWELTKSDFGIEGCAGLIFLVAAITKSAQVPFSAWLPAAMAAPTPVSALVHSSTLVTAGVYLMIRFSLGLPNKELLLRVGMVTMFIARLSALLETDIKKVVALSTLRQLGLIFLAIGTGFSEYRFFHLLIHAYFKAVMFIAVGNCIHMRSDYQDLRFLRLSAKPYAVSFTVCFISNASLMGLPFLAGFYSKDLIIETLADSRSSVFMAFLTVLSVIFTALYSLRFIMMVFFSHQKFSCVSKHCEFSPRYFFSMVSLSALAVVGGSFLRKTHYLPPSISTLRELKLLVWRMILAGGAFMLSKAKLNNDLYPFSLGSIFALPYLSSYFWSKTSFEIRNLISAQDLQWMRIIFPKRARVSTNPLNMILLKDSQFQYLLRGVLFLVILLIFVYLFSISVRLFAK